MDDMTDDKIELTIIKHMQPTHDEMIRLSEQGKRHDGEIVEVKDEIKEMKDEMASGFADVQHELQAQRKESNIWQTAMTRNVNFILFGGAGVIFTTATYFSILKLFF